MHYFPGMRLHVISWALLAATALPAAPEYPARGPDIYDPRADGFGLIDAALTQAQREHKRVLLDFGANWCPWCHRLDELFTSDEAVRHQLATGYVLVMIDVNRRHGPARNAAVNEKYGNPIRMGLPVLVVLDEAGRPLVTQETGAWEKGGPTEAHDPVKVLAFLARWSPPAPSPP
ncbi:MAG TPA: thioredoxin family protein [Opitutaceae bacterium]|nr:thioredoxin family protein [Opitutaceae bacterium]